MKALPEEEIIEQILEEIKAKCLNLRIPKLEEISFFTSASYAGLGGEHFGIKLNVECLEKWQIKEIMIHELVHYQGIYNHGSGFQHMYEQIKQQLKKEAEDVTNRKK